MGYKDTDSLGRVSANAVIIYPNLEMDLPLNESASGLIGGPNTHAVSFDISGSQMHAPHRPVDQSFNRLLFRLPTLAPL